MFFKLGINETTLIRRAITNTLVLCKENIIFDPDLSRVYRKCALDMATDYTEFDFFCFALDWMDLVVLEPEKAVEVSAVPAGPEIGTLAHTAQMMASIFPEGDWDAWKDDMKEKDL